MAATSASQPLSSVPPQPQLHSNSSPTAIRRFIDHWTAFWSQPFLAGTMLLGGIVWLLTLFSTFTYWYIFSSNSISTTITGGFYLAQAWVCYDEGRTDIVPAKYCYQYDLAVGPAYSDYLRSGGGASLAFVIFALVTIGITNVIVFSRRSGGISNEIGVCFKQHPSLPRLIAGAPFILHCAGLLLLFFAWVIYIGVASSGYNDDHFRAITVGDAALSSRGPGSGWALALSAFLLQIGVVALAFFSTHEPGYLDGTDGYGGGSGGWGSGRAVLGSPQHVRSNPMYAPGAGAGFQNPLHVPAPGGSGVAVPTQATGAFHDQQPGADGHVEAGATSDVPQTPVRNISVAVAQAAPVPHADHSAIDGDGSGAVQLHVDETW